jgi:hypothetical protein
MVNSASVRRVPQLAWAARAVAVYVVLAIGTVAALVVITLVAPQQAGEEAWWHAVIVAVFAVLLPLRLRAARRGSARACTAVAVIAAVLVVVNLVEATLPAFPGWMRVEMVVIAGLMAVVGIVAVRVRRGEY